MADVSVDPECKDPKELFGQGVRAYVLQDYDVAVGALSKASELLAAEHNDDMHASLGEVYLYYGKSLLGLYREQNEALGDAVPKNSAEDSEEEGDEQDEGVETEESEENKTETNSASSSVNGDAHKAELSVIKENTKESEDGSSQPEGSTKPEPSSSKEDGEATEEQENGEDTSDLQVAWEVLEFAKKIFQKQGDKKSLAETLIVLGEVSLENENFQAAINDIKDGYHIQKELFSKDSRAVAETLYKLGMAYSTNSQIDEAIDSFNNSLDYLKNRIKTLEETKSMSQENKDEVDEIKMLIPDIEDKITDMRTYKEEAIKKVAEMFSEPIKTTQDGASSSKQATDISHLVKRKRKLDEEDKSTDDVPAKKAAT